MRMKTPIDFLKEHVGEQYAEEIYNEVFRVAQAMHMNNVIRAYEDGAFDGAIANLHSREYENGTEYYERNFID